MPIASAIQRGTSITVYDEKNRTLFSKSTTESRNGLLGYTANSVSIRVGNSVITYDASGRQISSHYSPK
jgi:hypothetical protein